MNSVPQYLIYISLYVEAFLGIYMMMKVLPVKDNNKPLITKHVKAFLFFGLYCGLLTLQQYLGSARNWDTYWLYLGLHVLCPLVYAAIFHKGSLKLKFFLALIFASIVMLIAFPVKLTTTVFTTIFPSLGVVLLTRMQIIERIIRIFCSYLAILFLGRYPFSIDEKYPGSYYALMFFTPLLNISIMYALKSQIQAFYVVHIVGSCIFVLEFITYYMMWQTTTEYNRRIRSELVNQQMKYEVQYMNNLNEVVNEYHHLRHDMKNHITCMDLLLSQEKYEELKSYFYTLNKKVYAIDCQIETGNFLVNQVINMKYVTAESMNIPLEIHAKLPKKLNILDIRLCSLLSNLLDNAIEASEKIKDPFISVELSVVKCYLAIKVSNRIEDWQKPKALAFGTTKENTKLHGFGKHIIEKIVKKCNGTVDYEVKDDMFTVSILLLLEEDNQEEA